MKTYLVFAAGLAVGAAVVLGVSLAHVPLPGSSLHERHENHDHTGQREAQQDNPQAEGRIVLSAEQIRAADISVQPVTGGHLRRHFLAPGSIVPDADGVGRVSVRVVGTVSELRKRLGDAVAKGEIVATIESREVADAKSDYLAAQVTNELQQTLFARLKNLLESRAVSENEYLRARLTANDAQIRLDSARQKLFALGLSEPEIAALPSQPAESLRSQTLRSPIAGRVSERRVDIGGLIGREGQESELYVVVNLDVVWADLSVSPDDLVAVRENTEVTIRGGGAGNEAKATIIFVSPLLDKDTRNARVIARIENQDHRWKPGTFVTAEVPIAAAPARVLITKKAIQTVKGEPTVFVRTADGFEARGVKTGIEDDDDIEIVEGLVPGETLAISNTFTLKAELGKGEAEHEH